MTSAAQTGLFHCEALSDGWRDGDLVDDGVCSLLIAEKLQVSQPTCGEHLKILVRAGLIEGKKIKQWVFYRRAETAIAAAKKQLGGDW